MGWKAVKDHYRIGHIVHVTEEGICIGSPYINNLIVIGLDGVLKKTDDGRNNDDLRRYMQEMKADPEKLKELVLAEDKFNASIPVYTFEGATILEKQCETLGWPNVTHDGCLMYENTFSTNKKRVVLWAKENAQYSVSSAADSLERARVELAKRESYHASCVATIAQLEKDYPP